MAKKLHKENWIIFLYKKHMKDLRYHYARGLIITVSMFFLSCQKEGSAPKSIGVAALTVVNTEPNSNPVVTLINSTSEIMWFSNANSIGYGNFYEYSTTPGADTILAVQNNDDTLNINPKSADLLYYSVQPLHSDGIYSLFLCGTDTSAPDYLFTTDSLPYHNPNDSVMGIRFVNLSAGSNPMAVNLEGLGTGSEVGNLPYKSITGFKNYACNSGVANYVFVFRDAATGDSLTEYNFNASNNGFGLTDPNNGNLLTFRNVTIAIYGSVNSASNTPVATMLIDNYYY